MPDNYRVWTLLEALHLVFSVVTGIVVVFQRIGMMLFLAATNFSRLDISLLPAGFQSFDNGFNCMLLVFFENNKRKRLL